MSAVETRGASYPTSPGVALIINIKHSKGQMPRKGTEHDENNLKILFGIMGYTVITENDSTWDEFRESLRRAMGHFVKECFSGPFFLCIMCHGQSKDDLILNDRAITVSMVLSLFDEDHCKNLEGRAKVVLIQACRGSKYVTVQPDGTTTTKHYQPDSAMATDRRADLLVFRSSVDNRLSYLSESAGSIFFSTFCHVVASRMEQSEKCDLFEAVRIVTKEMHQLIPFRGDQVFTTPEITNMTFGPRPLYLTAKKKEHLKEFVRRLSRAWNSLDQYGDLADDGKGCRCKTGCTRTSKCGCRLQDTPCTPDCHQDPKARCTNRGCTCASTCETYSCPCYKANSECGRHCHPDSTMCLNGAETQPSTSGAEAVPPGRPNKPGVVKARRPKEGSTVPTQRVELTAKGADGASANPDGRKAAGLQVGDSSSKAEASCGCQTGCGTARCGCIKAEVPCGPKCHPKADGCQNKGDTGGQGSTVSKDDSRTESESDSEDESESSDGEDVAATCGCKTGCGTARCGCVKANVSCGSKCHPREGGCQNKTGSESEEDTGTEDDSESEKAAASCGCKTGCGTARCGCVKAKVPCGPKCHPKESGCQNTRKRVSFTETKAIPGKSGPAVRPSAKASSAKGSPVSEGSRATSCGCKTGCGSARCGCVKAKEPCGSMCHPKEDGCQNK